MSLSTRTLLTATWTQLTTTSPIGDGTMNLLPNGSVLMTGGGNEWAILTPNASGSYTNGTWTRTSNADYTRLYDSTQVLQNGDVFVAGGEYGTGTSTGELYNPTTNTWIQLPSQPYGEFIDSQSMLLANGNVLITSVYPSQSGYTTIFNTTTDTWSQGPKLYRGGDADEQGFVKLADGSFVTIDGASTSERYIPAQNAWVNDGAVPEDLWDSEGEIGPGALLNNGQVIYFKRDRKHGDLHALGHDGTGHMGRRTGDPNLQWHNLRLRRRAGRSAARDGIGTPGHRRIGHLQRPDPIFNLQSHDEQLFARSQCAQRRQRPVRVAHVGLAGRQRVGQRGRHAL